MTNLNRRTNRKINNLGKIKMKMKIYKQIKNYPTVSNNTSI